MNLGTFFSELPPVVRYTLVLLLTMLIIVIITNHELLNNLIHLLQAIPPVAWVTVNVPSQARAINNTENISHTPEGEQP